MADNSGVVDKTLARGFTWEANVIRVPIGTPREKVMARLHQLKKNFGNFLEQRGFTVLWMSGLEPDPHPFLTEKVYPGEARYMIYAQATRRPELVHFDMPDHMVPAMQGLGLKLNE